MAGQAGTHLPCPAVDRFQMSNFHQPSAHRWCALTGNTAITADTSQDKKKNSSRNASFFKKHSLHCHSRVALWFHFYPIEWHSQQLLEGGESWLSLPKSCPQLVLANRSIASIFTRRRDGSTVARNQSGSGNKLLKTRNAARSKGACTFVNKVEPRVSPAPLVKITPLRCDNLFITEKSTPTSLS